MKIAVFSDVHDNLPRWEQAVNIIVEEGVKVGICCGDIGDMETLEAIAKPFQKLYLCFGNLDHKLENKTGLFPENVEFFEKTGSFEIDGRKIAIVHYDYIAKEIAKEGKYDIVFYGHTHTPWEVKIGNTTLLNPGEISGQYGKPTFAIYDLAKMKAELKILR